MKRVNLKKLSIIIIPISIVMFFVIYSSFPMIYGKLYSGNHIEMDFLVYYQGRQVDIDCLEIKCVNPQNQVCQIEKDGSKYGVKGGEYGRYIFTLTIPKSYIDDGQEDIVIELQYHNSNDWYISNSECTIDIRNVDGVVSCKCKVNTKYNDDTSTEYLEEKQVEKGSVRFSWGI